MEKNMGMRTTRSDESDSKAEGVDMIKEDISYLFRSQDKNGIPNFTKFPNGLLVVCYSGVHKPSEVSILLYLVRMTYGFHKEETKFLELDDFSNATGLGKSQVSKAVRSLLKSHTIFWGMSRGKTYKYAINLLPFGLAMKHYRIGRIKKEGSGDKEYVYSWKRSEIGNLKPTEKDVIVYTPRHYRSKEER